jgi:hypothetical protein
MHWTQFKSLVGTVIHKKWTVYFLSALTLVAVGCATPLKVSFQNLKLKMDKSEVIEIVGSPSSTNRVEGQDVWTYKVLAEERLVPKIVIFKDSKVVYFGDPLTRENFLPVETDEEQKKETGFVPVSE